MVDGRPEPVTPPVIGLALSGGGSRAIAFHLGCLRASPNDVVDTLTDLFIRHGHRGFIRSDNVEVAARPVRGRGRRSRMLNLIIR